MAPGYREALDTRSEMNSTEVGDCALRQVKHLVLADAIETIDALRDHALDVLHKIKGRQSERSLSPDKAPMPAVPSLEEVLAEGPDLIHMKCSAVHEILNEINEALF